MVETATASRRLPVLAAAILVAVLLQAAPARAGDPVEDARVAQAETFLETLEGWNKTASKEDIERALPRLEKIHNGLQTRSVRAKLQRAAGDLLGNEELGGLRLAVADTCGRMNDPKGMWSVLRGHLPSIKEEAAGPLPLRVIQAVGALAPDAALSSLEKLVERAKDNNVARYAVQALGKYGWSRRREKVLDFLLDTLRKLLPGRAGGQGRGGGTEARERYQFLQATYIAALKELTGQKEYDSVEAWLEAGQEHKRDLGKLFTFER